MVTGPPPWNMMRVTSSPFWSTLCTPPRLISLKGSFDHIAIMLNGHGSLVPTKLSSHFKTRNPPQQDLIQFFQYYLLSLSSLCPPFVPAKLDNML